MANNTVHTVIITLINGQCFQHKDMCYNINHYTISWMINIKMKSIYLGQLMISEEPLNMELEDK